MSLFSKILDPIFGTDTSAEDAKAEKYLHQGTEAFDKIPLPDQNPFRFEGLYDLGDYKPTSFVQPQTIDAGQDVEYQTVDPRLADLERVSGTAFDEVSTDPRLRNQQYQSLDALDEIIQGGGLTAADQAALNRIQTDTAQADRGRREAILQNMQSRGMGGSGMELLAQLQSSQAATDRQNQSGLDVAGMAQQRVLDAIMQSGQLAGGMRGQDFGEQAQLAQARDAISQFNAQNANANSLANANIANQMGLANAGNQFAAGQYNRNTALDAQKANAANSLGAQQFNAQTANAASLTNQQRKQDLANANVDLRNQQQQANSQIKQQQFENQLAVAQGKAGTSQAGVNYYQGQGDRKAKKDAAYTGAVIGGVSTALKGT